MIQWILALLILFASTQNQPSSRLLIDFNRDSGVAVPEPGTKAKIRHLRGDQGGAIRIETDASSVAEELTFKAPGGPWDLTPYLAVMMDVHNTGSSSVLVSCSLNDSRWVDGAVSVPSGESRSLQVLLKRKSPPAYLTDQLFGMNGLPGGFVGIWEMADPAKITSLHLSLSESEGRKSVEIRGIRAEGKYDPPTVEAVRGLFPLVDEFGQYKAADWPGKIKSTDDFAQRRSAETSDINQNPPPDDWDRYGGWSGGPLRQATGHFRAEKFRDQWWFVDPEGRLFWSHGIDCVRLNSPTPISGRERYFQSLPVSNDPMAAFYGQGEHAPKGYYREHSPFRTFDFARANLLRKYGEEWERLATEIAPRRLRSWGMNTIGNWSDEAIYLLRRTPYVGTLHTGQPVIQGSEGNWGKFPDPFDPEFRAKLSEKMKAEAGKSAGDPWCIGYFVDNEMTWGDETTLALASLASPASQSAKQSFVADLKSRYEKIGDLNAKWSTTYASWQEVLDSRTPPEIGKARDDLIRFSSRLAEAYFRTCRDVIKETAPEALYLGCRFDFHFYPADARLYDWLLRIAARFCDVISFNRYRFSVSDVTLPEGVDKPIIVGEFHFGALDRGLLHTGLRSVLNQKQRGEMYRSYLTSALRNPYVVGTHWFQYQDQPVTGRSDGENYQIGFLDIADSPYAETIHASREVGAQMYKVRAAPRQ